METVLLDCVGRGGAVPSFEGAGSGRCWHHMGHHLYFLPEARALHRINGTASAVEATLSDVEDYAVLADASLDGTVWTAVLRAGYEPNDADRNPVEFDAAVPQVPFRFLRVYVPQSRLEGLAGYLDGSSLALTVSVPAAALPDPAPSWSLDCRAGVLESFFADHPCWFGGYDATDGAEPDEVHAAFGPGTSYYDSPSFVHTYFLGLHPGGALSGEVEVRGWRSSQLALCARSINGVNVPVQTLVVLQTSHDGLVWADVARDYHVEGEPVLLSATVPPGTRFLRAFTGQGVGDAEGACYHSQAFVVDSRFTIEPLDV